MSLTRKYNPYKGAFFGIDQMASSERKSYEKRRRHRNFRRQCKEAIWRELKGDDDVSHNFAYGGDYLL